MKPSLLIKFTAFVILASQCSLVAAQDAKQTQAPAIKATAAVEPPTKDPEYALLGEFVGPILIGENQYEPLGLQVRPLGNDQFEALQYKGGLPGQATFAGEDPIQLVGRRSGAFVVLSGGPFAIFVNAGNCLVIDSMGNKVGQLERVMRGSPTMGAKAPAEATILFDGTNTEQFTTARMTDEGLLMEGADTKPLFQDFNLHVEFRLPYMPTMDGQKRGNSGCYLQSRYEVQILDSFAQKPVFNGCSALYRTKSPDLNMCLPPLQWQTYDIQFTAPRWAAGGTKIRNARITVWHNGVKTQDNFEIPNKTGAGKPEEPNLLPIRFQNHSDPVRFRNIWIVDRGLANGEFPVYPKAEQSKPKSKSDAVAEANAGATEEPKDAQVKMQAVPVKAISAKPAQKKVAKPAGEKAPAAETPKASKDGLEKKAEPAAPKQDKPAAKKREKVQPSDEKPEKVKGKPAKAAAEKK